ncbi:C-X-C motif chemokine 11-like [Solea senegalensis]|nr:C-X-C motif chemokine 11-like [Solea senegalensis]
MAMSQKTATLLLFVVAAVYIELYQAQNLLGRCSCTNTIKFIRENITDFQVLEKRPACERTELIVTIAAPNNSTQQVCMNIQGNMAKNFLMCWKR